MEFLRLPRSLGWPDRGVRALLWTWPRELRQRQGREVVELYRDLHAEEGGGARFWIGAAGDLLAQGLAARAELIARLPLVSFAAARAWPRARALRRSLLRGLDLLLVPSPPGRRRGDGIMGWLWQDLRYGVRTLRKNPGFTLAILFSLALGIGANTAIFSVIRGVLLRPLPYAQGERLLHLLQPATGSGIDDVGFSPLEVADVRAQNRSLSGAVEYHSMPFTILGKEEAMRVQTGVVSHDFFEVMGVRPLLGRSFRSEDDQPGAPAVLVLSYGWWQHTTGGDRDIIGRTYTMNDRVHTVVGVLPEVPQYPDENDVYMPTSACPFRSGERWSHTRAARGLTLFGRLKPGVTLDAARADLASLMAGLHTAYPGDYPAGLGLGGGAALLQDQLTREAKPTLYILLGTALFLLLIVCANVANLTLARLAKREREMAVRTALGASRYRLLRQLLTESLLLSLVGAALGLLIAGAGLDLLIAFAARFTTRAHEIRIDGGVLLFTLVVAVATGAAIGTLPALPGRARLIDDLKDGSGGSAGGRSLRLRSLLIVSQVAVSFMLLIGAGLMLRSLLKLQQVNPGFDPQNVITARVDLNWSRYDSTEKTVGFVDALLRRLGDQPGTLSVAASGSVPLAGAQRPFNLPFQIDGRPTAEGAPSPQSEVRLCTADYFRTLGMTLLRGRGFEPGDHPPNPQVALVNQSFARHWFAGDDPLGKRVTFDGGKTWATLVGVVSDVKQYDLSKEPTDQVYGIFGFGSPRDLRVVMRTRAELGPAGARIREAVREIDGQQPVTDVRTLEQIRLDSLASPRLTAVLLASFAALALAITAAGIAGVIAFAVSQRTQEIGIRMALGAERGEVLRMMLLQGMRLVLFGLGVGAVAALVFSRLVAGLLFGIGASDPATFVMVSAVLLLVGSIACFVPARRAASVDPMIALRST